MANDIYLFRLERLLDTLRLRMMVRNAFSLFQLIISSFSMAAR